MSATSPPGGAASSKGWPDEAVPVTRMRQLSWAMTAGGAVAFVVLAAVLVPWHPYPGGALHPPHAGRAKPSDHAYIIDGRLVARSFLEFMSEAMDAVLAQRPDLAEVVSRYYLHQPNLRLLERFIDARGLPRDQVASHVETHGNTSAAGMLILLAEDVASRRVMLDSGDIVLISAVGAGVHFGAQLIRL